MQDPTEKHVLLYDVRTWINIIIIYIVHDSIMSQDAYGGKKSLIKIQRQSHDEKNNQSTRWKI
jgi:hypothetical protein